MSEWFFKKDQIIIGPVAEDDIRKLIARGSITKESMLRCGTNSLWAAAGSYEQFFPAEVPVRPPETHDEELQVSDDPSDGGQAAAPADLSAFPPADVIVVDGSSAKFSCPGCSQAYIGAIDRYRDSIVQCSSCGMTFRVLGSDFDRVISRNSAGHDFADHAIPPGDIICPHCWNTFSKEYLMYIAAHPNLVGDDKLGETQQKRFLPTVFNGLNQPLDAEGMVCTDMACPHCHLRIPSTIIDLPSLYFSIVGAPSSGKSYFLTSFTHDLRSLLPGTFSYSFLDVDPQINSMLSGYERSLYMSSSPDEMATIEKTQQVGEGFSNTVLLNGIRINLPKPFIFEIKPMTDVMEGVHENVILYDNAGEQFQAGQDTVENPATKHLATSNGIIFLFDPTADPNMRLACDRSDPQVANPRKTLNQTDFMLEMISRIRRHCNMNASEKSHAPCVVAVAKYDVWESLLEHRLRELSPWHETLDSISASVSGGMIQDVSFAVRQILLEKIPSLVSAAESFFEDVTYVPFSSFGTVACSKGSAVGIKPSMIAPVWVSVPFIVLLNKLGIIPSAPPAKEKDPSAVPADAKIVNGMIAFRHPVSRKRELLPLCFAGITVTIAGRKYVFPEDQNSAPDKKRSSGKKNDDFWN